MISLAMLVSGCGMDTIPIESTKSMIEVGTEVNGLEVLFSIQVKDEDASTLALVIDWGDDTLLELAGGDSIVIEERKLYPVSGTYEVSITAVDEESDSTFYTQTIDLAFKNTSLANLDEGLVKNNSNELLVLTLNLHTYQEQGQLQKLNMIANLIGHLQVDFVALQECAQHKNAEVVFGNIKENNMALLLSELVKVNYGLDYEFSWDWSHYGWNVWEEGLAIMSLHKQDSGESRFVSTSTSKSSINSRMALIGLYDTPFGGINIASAHTHWRTSETDQEQETQIRNIQQMAAEYPEGTGTLICGDFNVNPTSNPPWSNGYYSMLDNGAYTDTFLEIFPDANKMPAQSKYHTVLGSFPGRIDYVFMKAGSQFEVQESQIVDVIGKVSDHYGVLIKLNHTPD